MMSVLSWSLLTLTIVGQSVFHDPVSNRDVMVYHYVRKNAPAGGPSYLGINYLDFSSGWPVVVN